MGVYIKGMEVPKDCVVCPFGWNGCNKQHDFVYMGSRPDNCPLISVPEPHGRLIDAEELYSAMFIGKDGRAYPDFDVDAFPHSLTYQEVKKSICDAPTVIPACRDDET